MANQKQLYTALYERSNHVSDSPVEPNGILAQKKMLMEYAKTHNFSSLKHYSDEGISGNEFDRPALNEMNRDIKAGRISAVVVKDISRIGRNFVKVAEIVDFMVDNGVRLVSICDGIDTFSQAQIEKCFMKK